MRPVYIVGVGQTPITRRQGRSLQEMGSDAILSALSDAGLEPDEVGALYVGNMLSGILSRQQHLGALLAQGSGLVGVEAATVDACCGAGAAAMRWAWTAVAGGIHRTVIVAGVEAMSHRPLDEATAGLATASHWDTEGSKGETFVTLNAALMRTYLETYGLPEDALANFPINAHARANRNPNAVFHKVIDRETYLNSRMIHAPVRLFDASPVCDGAAAIVVTSDPKVAGASHPAVRVTGSAMATDTLALSQRSSLLELAAARTSAQAAMAQAAISCEDVDLFELHDAYSIMAALSLEAAGFAKPGQGYLHAYEGKVFSDEGLAVSSMGGLKGRGHPVGATGIYQLVEATLQLSGRAGACQLPKVDIALTQNIGGTGATVAAHVLKAV